MNCDELREKLQDYVDGELTPAERAEVEAKLPECPDVQQQLRQLEKFTTTMVQTVKPLRPGKDFTSKVLARYEDSKAELQRMPSERIPEPPAQKTYPVWPFAVGIVAVLILALVLLAGGPSAEMLGTLKEGADAARVQTFMDGAWKETPGNAELRSSDRVMATDEPGRVVELDLRERFGLAMKLRAPAAVQCERRAGTLVLMILPEAPGAVHLQAFARAPKPDAAKSVRVVLGSASAEIELGEDNEMVVEPGEDYRLKISVVAGSAVVKNPTDTQTVAEGFAREVPQQGSIAAATKADPAEQAWVGAGE